VAIRDKIRKNAEPFLEPGETIQAVFPAQGGVNPYFLFLTYLVFFAMKYVVVVATDRRILVLKTSMWRTTKAREVVGAFPRETRIGPVSGLYGKFELGGARYWVHRRFHKDVQAANAAATPAAPATAPA
jgi:hypothetical protein